MLVFLMKIWIGVLRLHMKIKFSVGGEWLIKQLAFSPPTGGAY